MLRDSRWIDFFSAIVEQVRDGSTIRARLLMPEGEHQFVNITLAGVRCPRVASRPGEASEQWGEEVSLNIFIMLHYIYLSLFGE